MTEEKDLLKQDIDSSMFEFAQKDAVIHDQKFDTKPVGFLRDAFRRFAKNKGSVFAGCVILILLLFALFAPLASKYELKDKDPFYKDKAPYVDAFKNAGFWDGGRVIEVPEAMYTYYYGIYVETGYNPILKVIEKKEVMVGRNKETYYKIRLNTYHALGVLRSISLSREDYASICEFQNETGIQVIYPYVEKRDINELDSKDGGGNYWYKINSRGQALLSNGQFQPVYALQSRSMLYPEYNSLRIAGDPYNPETHTVGYAYAKENTSGYEARVCYWNYYIWKNGFAPQYAFGTNSLGQDMLNAVGKGARFSLLLAVCVSAINLVLGTIYGAIEGYYGGIVDMTLERISDILSGIPLMIVVTLFNLHLGRLGLGVVPIFILAFVATGWIGMASLVRKQFYRFKGQEYVLAARTLGASDRRIMFKHIFPNSLGTIVTSCVLVIPGVIGSETMLTYLGIVNLSGDKLTSIGALMELGNEAAKNGIYHVLLIPAIFFALLMLSFNLFGNGLRDAFNPSLRGSEG